MASKLSRQEKLGYALGDTASNLYWKSFEFFLLIFYTDVFGLSPAAAGTMFGVTRLIDAICDPVMGSIADRTRTRWGRFRPYLLWGAIPFAAAGVLTFTTPDLQGTAKIVYAYVTYNFLMLAYTAINIPYSALMGVMTSDTEERTALSSWRFAGGFGGGLLVVSATPWLVATLGRGDAELGWQLAMVVWGAVAVALFLVTFLTTRERVEPPAEQVSDLPREVRDLLGNGPWLVMFALGVLTLTGLVMRGQTTAYFFKYYVKNEALLGVFVSSHMLAVIAGVVLTAPLTRLLGGKRNLYGALLATTGVLFALFFAIPPEATATLVGVNILVSFIGGPLAPLVWAMYADTADFAEWKNGRRNTGLVFAAATMAQKGGGALAGVVSGGLLTSFGYVANVAQSSGSVLGIRMMMSLIPGGLLLVAAGVTFLYRLDDRCMKAIEVALLERRAQAAEAAARLPGA